MEKIKKFGQRVQASSFKLNKRTEKFHSEGDLRQGVQYIVCSEGKMRFNLAAIHHLCWKEGEAKVEKVGGEVMENLDCQAEFRQWSH